MKRTVLILLLLSVSSVTQGIDCKQLTRNRDIIQFVKQTKSANPLMREKISVLLETSPCEKELCLQKNLQKRLQKKETIHIIRSDQKKRLTFLKGENAPQCFVEIGEKEFKCDSCEQRMNYNCRSYRSSDNSGRFKGTNIDARDMDLLTNENNQSVCHELPKAAGYFKITTSIRSGNSGYDQIETYYEKSRQVPVIVNFYAKQQLHKVYRFFISRYFLIHGNWYSTFFRVRTTLGREKYYEFETTVRVLKDRNGKFHLFVDPENDPLISRGSWNDLFRTN